MRLNAIMAVVTVSCVVAVVAGPRIGPLNIRGHHIVRGGAATNNHWRDIGMEYLDDEGGPLAVTLASALGGRSNGRLLAKYSQDDEPTPGDPVNPLGPLGHAFTGLSKFALANSRTTPSKAAPANPPAPPAPPAPPSPAAASGGIQPFVAPTEPPPGPPDPGPPDPGPPDPGPPDPGPPVIEPPVQNPPTPVVVVTRVVSTPTPPAAPPALPEPGTWMLMLLGLGGAGVALRRRRGIRTRAGAQAV